MPNCEICKTPYRAGQLLCDGCGRDLPDFEESSVAEEVPTSPPMEVDPVASSDVVDAISTLR